MGPHFAKRGQKSSPFGGGTAASVTAMMRIAKVDRMALQDSGRNHKKPAVCLLPILIAALSEVRS
jgi:hypothetical protein